MINPPGEWAESGQSFGDPAVGAWGLSTRCPGPDMVSLSPQTPFGGTLGVQNPGCSPARDVSGGSSHSQYPTGRQELHGCNHAAVGAQSPAQSPSGTERQSPGRARLVLQRALMPQ